MSEENGRNDQAEEKSFAELLNDSYQAPVKLKPGDKTTAVVFKVTDQWIFLDLGGKSEGCLAKAELVGENGETDAKEGDRLEVYLLSETGGELVFTTKVGKGAADRSLLAEAYRNRIPVEGTVDKEIKGGFSVKLAGSARAFCPYSQMGIRRVENGEAYTGKALSFLITEFSENGRNIVLSNRAVLEAEQMKKKEVLKDSLKVGDTVSGTVTAVRGFGAFIDIDGAEGLVPISEIGWGRIEDIHDHIYAGQKVEAEVIKLDWGNNRLSFSLKARQPDPWQQSLVKYAEGTVHHGTVSRLAKFGAFVTLEPGIDGLMHISKIGRGKRINHPGDVLKTGQGIPVKIEKLDIDKKRISLVMDAEEPDAELRNIPEAGKKGFDMSEVINPPNASFGTLGDILKAKLKSKK